MRLVYNPRNGGDDTRDGTMRPTIGSFGDMNMVE